MQYSSIAALSGLLTAGSEKSCCILQKFIHFTQTTIFFFQRLDPLFQLLILFGNARCFFRAAFADPRFLANLIACTLYSSSYSLFFDIFVSSVFPFFLFYSLVACVSSFIIQNHPFMDFSGHAQWLQYLLGIFAILSGVLHLFSRIGRQHELDL